MASQPTSIFGEGRTPTDLLHLKGKVFQFFKLPLELRKQIYDYTLVKERLVFSRKMKRIRLLDYQDKHLSLVSRQFRDELEDRASKVGMLVIEGDSYSDPRLLSKVQHFAPAAGLRLIAAHELVGWKLQAQPNIERLMTFRDFETLRKRALDLLPQIAASREVSFDIYVDLHSRSGLLSLTSGPSFQR